MLALPWTRIAVGTCVVGTAVGVSYLAASSPARERSTTDWSRVVARLQYIEGDYGEAVEENSAAELEEQARIAAEAAGEARRGATTDADRAFASRIFDLESDIRARRAPIPVHDSAASLVADIARSHALAAAPAERPDLSRGQSVYATACAPCHGDRPGVVPPAAAALDPRPPSFFTADVTNSISPWKAYNFVTHGIPGTAMRPFAGALSQDDRWAVAFYVFTLRQPACASAVPKPAPLAEVAALSDNDLAARFGEAEVPCLRRGSGVPAR